MKALATNVHDDGSSPSVMKALATESRSHRGKAFFLFSVSASVAIFFHGKGKEKLFFVLFVVPFFSEPFATASFEGVAKAQTLGIVQK